ncbi:hypothetical protein GCM10007173_34870 [Glutamicibacter ardleyensis]|uniref:Uncharacterized protein n=1 Tax=Glutamicibacter ardleyensis TaxID=225894 RepID=A0ABQ2DTW1_9MICC|nr:hypothetical protein GCM10007173_34870 [Glutamicibacter ardleyensis]
MTYGYTPRQLETWPELAHATALQEQVTHLTSQIEYWRGRCISLETRVQAHDCEGEK